MPEGLVPYSYVSVASLRVQSLTACVVLPELETVSRQTVLIYGLDSFRRIADRNLNLSTASARRLDSTCSTARRRVARLDSLDGSTRRSLDVLDGSRGDPQNNGRTLNVVGDRFNSHAA